MDGWAHTMRRLQYKTLIRTSIGALQMDKRFLARNKRGETVTSAKRPTEKVKVDSESPMTVKYWKCQPYASFLRHEQPSEMDRGSPHKGDLRLVGIIVHTRSISLQP